jgi:hypothetical protein
LRSQTTAVDGPPDGISSLWLKRGVRASCAAEAGDRASRRLAGFQHHAGYRVARTEWASLLLLAVGRDGWPTRRSLAGASLAPYHLVDAVEYVSLGMPELFAALARAAHSLARLIPCSRTPAPLDVALASVD